ncbi:hypothetical protein V8C86DRAFT_2813880 [Haematococcus lacustris]
MGVDSFAPSTFDPRKHSAVCIAAVEKLPFRQGTQGEELALKHYRVGPNVLPSPPPGLSLRRTHASTHTRSLPDGSPDPTPRFLSKKGHWVQSELSTLVAESQAQPLTATPCVTTRLPGPGAGHALRPVTAVHSYNDVSPVCHADMVQDMDLDSTLHKDGEVARPRSAAPHGALVASQQARAAATIKALRESSGALRGGLELPEPDVRQQSIKSFWQRQTGTAFALSISDLDRVQELGRPIPPESPNTRLIGSRWRYIDRPLDGDLVYKDYYGRYGPHLSDYYGRSYHIAPGQFNKSRVVGDMDYVKVQASLPGIHALRTRPGLVMEATIANGKPERLQGLSMYDAKHGKGVHRITEFSRLAPAAEREIRNVWAV